MAVRGRHAAEPGARGRRRTGVEPSGRQLVHRRRHVGPWCQPGHELVDLALAPVRRPAQDLVPVLGGEVRSDLRDRAEVQSAVGQHRQENGMLARGASCSNAEAGLGLREVEPLGAVDEHRSSSLSSVEPTPVDLADVGHDIGLHVSGVREELGEPAEKIVVGQCLEREVALHSESVSRDPVARNPKRDRPFAAQYCAAGPGAPWVQACTSLEVGPSATFPSPAGM
jgi:hypothetical protein